MDIDCSANIVEDLVESSKSGVVAPAVDIGRLNIKGFFAESFCDELGHTGLPRTTGTGYDSSIGWLSAGDWLENTGEVIDLCITMLDFLGNEPSTEDASISDHVLQDRFYVSRIRVIGLFPEMIWLVCDRALCSTYSGRIHTLYRCLLDHCSGKDRASIIDIGALDSYRLNSPSILNPIPGGVLPMSSYESTLIRQLIEKNEPIEDIELNFLLVDEGIDPHDAIIIEDILEEQGRIDYDPETRCFRQSLTLGRSLDFVVSDFGSLTAWALRDVFVNAVPAVTAFIEELVRRCSKNRSKAAEFIEHEIEGR